MKKCILIGALAALMLFAFTACEQPGLTLPANVDYITVVQTKDFVDGDKFNAANFTVYAHDTNGGNTPVNGAKVEIDPTGEALAAGNTVEAGTTYTVKATLNVATSDNPLTATQTFTAYALESYEVNGMPSLVAFVVTTEEDTQYVKAAPSDSSVTEDSVLKSVKVSGVYANGETRELSAADIKDNLYVTDAEGNKIAAAAFTVGTTYYLSVGTGTDAKLTNITVLAVEEAPQPEKDNQTGIEVTVSEKNYLGQSTGVKAVATYSNKDDVDITASLSNYVIVETSAGNKVVDSLPSEFDASSHTYRITDPTNTYKTTITIPAGKNYYVYDADGDSVTVEAASLKNDETYKFGQAISGSNVKVTISTGNTETESDGTTLKYAVADSIQKVELVGVTNIPTSEALGTGVTEFKVDCKVTYTSMGEVKTVTKEVTFNNLSK